MSDERIDMKVPETFHRLKRTVLLFSAALILLALAEPTAGSTLHAGLLQIELEWRIACAVLWIGGAYYAFGFCLEFMVVRRLNSQYLAEHRLEDFDRHIAHLTQRLLDFEGAAGRAVNRSLDRLTSIRERHGLARRALLAEHRRIHAEANARVETVRRSLVTLVDKEFRFMAANGGQHSERIVDAADHVASILLAVERVPDGVSGPEEIDAALDTSDIVAGIDEGARRAAELRDSLARLQREMTRLNKDVLGSRRVAFYGWETAGALGSFVIATLFQVADYPEIAFMVVAWLRLA